MPPAESMGGEQRSGYMCHLQKAVRFLSVQARAPSGGGLSLKPRLPPAVRPQPFEGVARASSPPLSLPPPSSCPVLASKSMRRGRRDADGVGLPRVSLYSHRRTVSRCAGAGVLRLLGRGQLYHEQRHGGLGRREQRAAAWVGDGRGRQRGALHSRVRGRCGGQPRGRRPVPVRPPPPSRIPLETP